MKNHIDEYLQAVANVNGFFKIWPLNLGQSVSIHMAFDLYILNGGDHDEQW